MGSNTISGTTNFGDYFGEYAACARPAFVSRTIQLRAWGHSRIARRLHKWLYAVSVSLVFPLWLAVERCNRRENTRPYSYAGVGKTSGFPFIEVTLNWTGMPCSKLSEGDQLF